MPKTYTPTWKTYEKDANNPHDAKKALAASDAFEEERAKEMKTSKLARDWENDRKATIAKDKPAFVKKRLEAEREEVTKPFKSLKELGSFDGNIKPFPGYLIVELDVVEQKTESGLYLAPERTEPNTGVVVEVSEPLLLGAEILQTVECPVKIGDKILFKRYAGAMGSAGAELTIKGKEYRLMRWHVEPDKSDILGVFTE